MNMQEGVEEEMATRYMLYEESDYENEEEDKDHEGHGLPSTS